MKITFLGTSHGVPEANRRCSCTMVEIGGRYYFIDMGMMAMEEMVTKGFSVEMVKGIFITHMHGDHMNGLFQFLDLIGWYFKTADPTICFPDIDGARIIGEWHALCGVERKLRYEEVKPGIIFEDDKLTVTAIPTQHIKKSYAFLLKAEGKSVLFIGDLKKPSVDFPQIAKECEIDLAVCEGAHFPTIEYEPVLAECKIKKVCINHYVPRNIPHIQQLVRDMDIPVIMVNDGMEITV